MKPNKKYLSFYYETIDEIPDIEFDPAKTALLVVDMQKHFLLKDGYDAQMARDARYAWINAKTHFSSVC